MTNRQWLLEQMQNMSDEEFAQEYIDFAKKKTHVCENKGETCKNFLYCDDCVAEWLKAEHKEIPKLSDAERVILENVDKDYKWIARDKSGAELKVYTEKPIKTDHYWNSTMYQYITPFNHLFQFIKWEDEQAYNIQELLEV